MYSLSQASSGQPSSISKQVQPEPDSFGLIALGEVRVDFHSCQERVAVRCLTCLQPLWALNKDSGRLRLTFRKSQERKAILRGYLVTSEIPKAKQSKQIVCLSCIGRLLGNVTESADKRSILIKQRRDGGEDVVVLQRLGEDNHWTQTLELTSQIVAFLVQQNETTLVRKKRRLNAAEQVVNKGAAKGARLREGGVPGVDTRARSVSATPLFS